MPSSLYVLGKGTLAQKKKSAAKAAPAFPTDSHVDEVNYEPAPSDEEESGKTPNRGATPTTNAEATLPARKEPSPPNESPSDSSSSSSSDSEEALRATIRGDSGKPMKPEELAMLLYTEEATVCIVALRDGREPTPFSPGSALLAFSVANESMVSTAVPATSSAAMTAESTAALKSSPVADTTVLLASSNSSAVVSSAAVGSSTVQTTGGSSPTLSIPPANPSPSSATKSNLSLSSSTADIAAVIVTAADLRGVPRLNDSSDRNVPEILSHSLVIVGLKAKRIRPGDEKFGNDVALQHIALLGEGHCITLVQQLLTGKIDISSATVTVDPGIPGAFTPRSTWQEMTRALLDLLMPANSIDNCARQIASFNQKGKETVASRTLCAIVLSPGSSNRL